MSYTPKHLKLWTMPNSYFGATWENYYVFFSRSRDSDILSNSNFECGLSKIGGESDTVQVVREGHWAVGWVEWIAIEASDIEALKKADDIMKSYDIYPVVDESHYSDLETEEYQRYAESEQKYLAEFLCALFSLPEEFSENKELLEVAYELNMESQYRGGENSAFNHNVYALEKNNDWDYSELIDLMEHIESNHADYWNKNEAFLFIKASLGLE